MVVTLYADSAAAAQILQLRRFGEMLKPKHQLQLVHDKRAYRREYAACGVTVIDYETFFAGLR